MIAYFANSLLAYNIMEASACFTQDPFLCLNEPMGTVSLVKNCQKSK